jgi:hypothetical protein
MASAAPLNITSQFDADDNRKKMFFGWPAI